MWIFQQIVLHGLKLRGFLIVQHTGYKTGNSVNHNSGRQFSPGQHIIPDGHIICHHFLQYPLINPLVMTAEENQLFLHSQFLYHGLAEYLSLRRQVNTSGLFSLPGCLGFFSHRFISSENRFGLHNHTGASAIGIIIDPHVFVISKIPDIYRMKRNFSAF